MAFLSPSIQWGCHQAGRHRHRHTTTTTCPYLPWAHTAMETKAKTPAQPWLLPDLSPLICSLKILLTQCPLLLGTCYASQGPQIKSHSLPPP